MILSKLIFSAVAEAGKKEMTLQSCRWATKYSKSAMILSKLFFSAVAEAGKKGDDLTKLFFKEEYMLNHTIGELWRFVFYIVKVHLIELWSKTYVSVKSKGAYPPHPNAKSLGI